MKASRVSHRFSTHCVEAEAKGLAWTRCRGGVLHFVGINTGRPGGYARQPQAGHQTRAGASHGAACSWPSISGRRPTLDRHLVHRRRCVPVGESCSIRGRVLLAWLPSTPDAPHYERGVLGCQDQPQPAAGCQGRSASQGGRMDPAANLGTRTSTGRGPTGSRHRQCGALRVPTSGSAAHSGGLSSACTTL